MTTGCAVKSSLINAASKGDTLTTQKQINEGANINEVDKNGATPLMHAIWNGQTETAKALVSMGADVNVKDSQNSTALLYAASHGYYELTEILIKKGADINIKAKSGETALTNVADYKIAKLLVDGGADINAQNNMGMTALHYTAQTYNDNRAVMIAEYLLSKNASTNLKDINGWTALRHAIYNKNIDIVVLIRKKTNWEEEIESLSMDEALRSPSYYKPAQDMFNVPADRERAYKIAVTDCNLIIIPNKTGLLIGTGGVGYGVGLIVDAVTIKRKFQKCMDKMGFQCIKNCST
jgi:ankyrin repeat protein